MSSAIQEFVLSILPGKKKQNTGGWISFNAVCCTHNGETADTRGRGGIHADPDGKISYNCFNCNFTASYIPGRPIYYKFRKLLSWFGVSELEIQRLVIEAWRIKELTTDQIDNRETKNDIIFDKRPIPNEAQSFLAWAEFYTLADRSFPKEFVDCVQYVYNRKINLKKYDFYWTPEVEHKLSHRVVIPFLYKDEIVGYSARALNSGIKPKYHSDQPPNYVFNLDKQLAANKFVIVCEGPFDAMSIDGVAILSNDISETQAELIESLDKPVIVVPDFDRHLNKSGKEVWPGAQLIRRAIEFGWSVSFPVWRETCKDVNEAVIRFGKLFVVKSILAAKESSSLKIKLLSKIL
jgi:hypothetical protein